MILPCEPPVSYGRRERPIGPPTTAAYLSITGDSACRALYNNHVLNPRSANEVLPLAVCPELSENSRLEFESECAPTKLGPSGGNPNSTLGMHVSLPKTCGRSRVQTWNRYAYVGNNPLNHVDRLGLAGQCTPKTCTDPHQNDDVAFYLHGLIGCPGYTLEGFAAPCSLISSLASSGAIAYCPQCKQGQVVGNDNKIYSYGWIKGYFLYFGDVNNGDFVASYTQGHSV